MRDLILAAVMLGSIPFILRSPFIGIAMWLWIGSMNPHRLAWGWAYDFSWAQLIAVVTLVSFLLHRDQRTTIPMNALMWVWILFLGWMLVTTTFAFAPGAAWAQADKVAKIQLFALLAISLIRTPLQLKIAVAVVALGIGFYGFKGGVYTILGGGSGRVQGPGGFIGGNNELGLAMLMILPLLFWLRSVSRQPWQRTALLIGAGLTFIAILGTQSRGAFVGMVAVLFYFWLKSRSKVITGILGIIAVSAALTFMPQSWHERMESIRDYEQDTSAMGRINHWWAAFHLANDRPLGAGFDGINDGRQYGLFARYAPDPNDYHDSHSIYFEVLGDHGWVGLSLFLLLGLLAFAKARRLIRDTQGVPELEWVNVLGRMVQVSLVAYATSGAFLGLAYFNLYYHLLAFLVIGERILVHHQESAAARPATGAQPVSTTGASRPI